MIDEHNNDYEDEDFVSFLEDDDEEDSTDEDDLASFLEEDDEEDVDLASFLDEDEEDVDLASFLEEDEEDAVEEDLDSFLDEEEGKDADDNDFDDDLVAEDAGSGWMDSLTGGSKPSPILAYKKENRKARLDITKNSKEDHRYIKRYTKKEIEDQLKKDYRYMLGKPYMVIQPLTILAEYPFKKKSSDADIPNKDNVDLDYVICIGKILKWRGTEQFKGKPYRLGRIMYLRRGDYWVNGKIQTFDPHFAIVLSKSYKRIKSKRIRDLFLPLKQRLRSGKPFGIYKEFPIIVKRSGSYS